VPKQPERYEAAKTKKKNERKTAVLVTQRKNACFLFLLFAKKNNRALNLGIMPRKMG